MGPDRRLVAPLVGLVAVLGILGCLCWIRWPHEYRGVLKDNTGAVGIPEDPLPPAYLVTATGTHELAFSERGISFWKSNWRSKLQE
ncbi:MAG TPA: hypothetical protein VMV94_00115, partial [Phycisphaerae bacterium]|nr:hypothetical protein [Phycisphaerae bacterium]